MGNTFDIAIIGAGPAGTAAAIYAAQKGLNVILVDSNKNPVARPGESLPPGAEALFRQLGIWDKLCELPLIRNKGHYTWQQGNKEKTFHTYGQDENGEWQGMQIPRDKLDMIARQHAQTLGVTFNSDCHIKNIIVDKQKMILISSKNQTIHAKYYIDATGHHHVFARLLGINMIKHSPQLIAKYGYMTQDCPYKELPIFIQDEKGWSWYAEVAKQYFAWVRIETRMHSSSLPHKISGGADVTWRMAHQTAGPHYFITGDAACILDPSAGHGVLRALMTGMMAANTIVNILNQTISPSHAYQQYHCWLHDWYMKDMHELRNRLFYKENGYAVSNI